METRSSTSLPHPAKDRASPADCLLSHLLLTSAPRLTGHHRRVGRLCEALALRLGLDEDVAAKIGHAGTLHDIGMTLVPDEVLHEAGPISPNEKDMIQRHSRWGSELLAYDPDLDMAARVAMQHHERWNGSGYPLGLAGEDISLEARIVAVCAVYDALRHPREGKRPLDEASALAVLRDGDAEMRAGGFDPVVLGAFADLLADLGNVPDFRAFDRPTPGSGMAVLESGGPADGKRGQRRDPGIRYVIAIVDDDDAVRRSSATLLRGAGHRVECYSSGSELLASDLRSDLDCILLDLHMPGLDGFAVMRKLRERGMTAPILVLTGNADVPTAVEAMRLGAVDFLEKPCPPEGLAAAVARACQPSVSSYALDPATSAGARRKIATLTGRQRDVLGGIVKGHQNKVIAQDLGLSIRTVETYRAQLFVKLDVGGTAEAVKLAVAAGLRD
jgi:two-component system response regulator FixJ